MEKLLVHLRMHQLRLPVFTHMRPIRLPHHSTVVNHSASHTVVGDMEGSAQKAVEKSNEVKGKGKKTSGSRMKEWEGPIPESKTVPGTSFLLDGFKYRSSRTKSYFLSHFHSDHYCYLGKSFNFGYIYCSKATAKLVIYVLGVDPDRVRTLEIGKPAMIEGVEVKVMDANHCPGALLMLFNVSGSLHLHTGDMRWSSPLMKLYPELKFDSPGDLTTLFLDTTYSDPKYKFPTQDSVIEAAVKIVNEELNAVTDDGSPRWKHPVFLCGTYTIGKENLVVGLAKWFGWKIFVDERKYNLLRLCELDAFDDIFTRNPTECRLHMVPMGFLGWRQFGAFSAALMEQGYDRVVGFRPTGWSFSTGPSGGITSSPAGDARWRSPHVVWSVPYSEHSSFAELQESIRYLRPAHIVPTVNAESEFEKKEMVRILRGGDPKGKRTAPPAGVRRIESFMKFQGFVRSNSSVNPATGPKNIKAEVKQENEESMKVMLEMEATEVQETEERLEETKAPPTSLVRVPTEDRIKDEAEVYSDDEGGALLSQGPSSVVIDSDDDDDDGDGDGDDGAKICATASTSTTTTTTTTTSSVATTRSSRSMSKATATTSSTVSTATSGLRAAAGSLKHFLTRSVSSVLNLKIMTADSDKTKARLEAIKERRSKASTTAATSSSSTTTSTNTPSSSSRKRPASSRRRSASRNGTSKSPAALAPSTPTASITNFTTPVTPGELFPRLAEKRVPVMGGVVDLTLEDVEEQKRLLDMYSNKKAKKKPESSGGVTMIQVLDDDDDDDDIESIKKKEETVEEEGESCDQDSEEQMKTEPQDDTGDAGDAGDAGDGDEPMTDVKGELEEEAEVKKAVKKEEKDEKDEKKDDEEKKEDEVMERRSKRARTSDRVPESVTKLGESSLMSYVIDSDSDDDFVDE